MSDRSATRAQRRVGMIGLGRMGLPMCARLAERGCAMTATDLRHELQASAAEAGAQWARSAAELAAGCDVLITMLPGPGEVSGIVDELTEALRPGSTWIDMSSATPDIASQIAGAARGRGIHILDAPVGGGPAQARSGQLLAFVGGSAEAVQSERELLEIIAARVLHVGAAGGGYAVKLLVNMLWFGQAVASAEALSLAVRAGLDPQTVRLAVQESAAASRFMERDAPAFMAGDDLTSFSLARCLEELTGVLALGEQFQVRLAVTERVSELYEQALERYGDVDGELLGARAVAERAGVDFSQLRVQSPG